MSFKPATAKLTIGSVDDPGITVSAQYNPKELQVDQSVPWKKPDAATQNGTAPGGGGGGSGGSGGGGGGGGGDSGPDNTMALEFTGAEGRTMSVEMLFDGYEGNGAPGGRNVNVAAKVAVLETLARVRDPSSTEDTKRRPHFCVVTWGAGGLPKFQCVIENLSTKYSMFSSEGMPLRATCTVKLKEASRVDKKKGG